MKFHKEDDMKPYIYLACVKTDDFTCYGGTALRQAFAIMSAAKRAYPKAPIISTPEERGALDDGELFILRMEVEV